MKKLLTHPFTTKGITLAKAHKILSAVIVVVILGGGYWVAGAVRGETTETRYVTEQVALGTLISSVSGVGQVSVSEQVDINPNVSGRVVSVSASKGQIVNRGDLLVSLDARNAQRSVSEAEVSLETAQIDLEELLAGTDTLTLLEAENALAQAERTLEKAQYDYDTIEADAEKILKDAYAEGYDTVSDSFFTLSNYMEDLRDVLGTEQSSNEHIGWYEFVIGDDSFFIDRLLANYETANILYTKTFKSFSGVYRTSDREVVYQLISDTHETSDAIAEALQSARHVFDAVKGRNYEDYYFASSIDSLATQVESDVSGVFSIVTSLEETLDTIDETVEGLPGDIKDMKLSLSSAEEDVERKRQDLEDIKAGIDPLDVRTQRNLVAQRESELADAQENFADHYIRAPFAGIVADVDVSIGESVSSGTTVVTLLSDQQILEIALNEIDVVKVKEGQKATITFDAVEDLTVTGEVVSVDTLGTVTQGVVSYDVTIAFDIEDERVKPGMSASVSIITEAKQNVLIVPNSAVQYQGTNTTLQVMGANGIPTARQITVGSYNDTHTEIVSGLEEGEEVITQTINTGTTNSSQTGAQTGGTNSIIPGGGGFGGGGARVQTR